MNEDTTFDFRREYVGQKNVNRIRNKDIRNIRRKIYQDEDLKIKLSSLNNLRTNLVQLGFSARDIDKFLTLSVNMTQINFMNMTLLARVYQFLVEIGDIEDTNQYDRYILPIIKEDKSKLEKQKLLIRWKVNFYRYLKYVESSNI